MAEQREWKPRKKGVSIGRLTYIPSGLGELDYLRLLLNFKKGCCDYDNNRSVNGVIYKTYKEVCYAMELLTEDKEFTDAIIETNNLASGIQLRRLLVTLLFMNTMSRHEEVWNKTWKLLSDDIVYQKRKEFNLPGINLCFLKVYNILFSSTNDIVFLLGLTIEEGQLENLCLLQVEDLLLSNGKSLKHFNSLPQPIHSDSFIYENRFIIDELNYDKIQMSEMHASLFQSLTTKQLDVYENIMTTVLSQVGGFFSYTVMVAREKRLCGKLCLLPLDQKV